VQDIFDKEVTNAFEAGFKSRLADGRVSIEGSAFFTKVDDMQFFEFLVGPFGVIRAVSNIDRVDIKGAELGLDFKATDALSLYAAGSVVDGEVKENSSRPLSKGNEVPYAPKWTANVGADLRMPTPFPNVKAIARADWSFVGPTWFHVIQDQAVNTVFGFPQDYTGTRRDKFDTVNLRLGLEGERWAVYGFARNLFDEEYLDEVIPVPEFAGSSRSALHVVRGSTRHGIRDRDRRRRNVYGLRGPQRGRVLQREDTDDTER
jgi:iron complex outermembrane receptor protein